MDESGNFEPENELELKYEDEDESDTDDEYESTEDDDEGISYFYRRYLIDKRKLGILHMIKIHFKNVTKIFNFISRRL